MCRLFGLIANKQVDIRFSMLEAYENLKKQGKENPHGWGIGWYENSNPMVKKHGENAFYSREFDNLVAEVHSKVFIAHVRYASSGSANSEKNAHPFVYENWVFAHNGTIDRERIQSFLRKPFNENYTSEPIDSEVYFRFILQHIYQNNDVRSLNKGLFIIIQKGGSKRKETKEG